MTRFQRPMSASTKAGQLYPEAFCQPMRPCSAIACRCRSRRVGAFSVVPLGTPLERGGTMTGIGMAGSDLAVDAVLVVCTIAGQRSDGIINLVEQGTDLRAVIDIIGGQRRRDDPAGVGIDTDVQFAPRPAPARTVLLDQPFAGARQLQPS